MLRIAVVNKYYPPDAAVTGKAAAELVEFLRSNVAESRVRVFASSARYWGGVKQEGTDHDVERVPGVGVREKGAIRLLASCWEGHRLARRAVRWADVVISLTDPPLLGLWIGRSVAATNRAVRWIEWTMDVYPEAFAAAGLVASTNPAYRYVARSVARNLPDRYICLGPRQHAAVERFRDCMRPVTILPCGIVGRIAPMSPPPAWRVGERRVVVAYAGNLGEAHCARALIGLVEQADPERVAFLLSIYGSKADDVSAALRTRANVVWRDHLQHCELAHADVHVAILKRHWAHICVPSKAVSTVCLGKPLLFIGPADADTMGLLAGAAWHLPDSLDGRYGAESLEPILAGIMDAAERGARAQAAERIATRLADIRQVGLRELATWLQRGTADDGSLGTATVDVRADHHARPAA